MEAGSSRNTEGMDIDLRALTAGLRRYWLMMTVIVVLALAFGVAITLRAPELYRATATVQIEQQSSNVLTADDNQLNATQDAERFLQTQLSILNSRALAGRVAKDLDLGSNSKRHGEEGAEPSSPEARQAVVIDTLQSGLSVTLPRDSRVAQITYVGADRALVARIANSYAQNFIDYNLQRRFGESSYARDFLQKELQDAKRRLEESEREVLSYARENRIVDVNGNAGVAGTGGESLTTSSLLNVNQALSKAEIDRLEAERLWRQAISTPSIALPDVMNNSAVQQLLQQRAQLQAQYGKDRKTFTPDYPVMQETQAQIAALNQQIEQLASAFRTRLRNNYELAAQEQSALQAKLESLKSETLSERSRSIQYNILQREVDTSRLMYDGLLQRFKEVSAAAGVTANNISIVDRAEMPERPFSPNARLNLASALVAGLSLALLLGLIRFKIDDTIRTPEDIASQFDVPLLGTIPSKPEDMSIDEMVEGSSIAEAFWSLRIALDHMFDSVPRRSLLITSSRESEGKSTTAFAIALGFARSGQRVVLIDGDLRRPTLHRMLDIPNDVGLASVISGDTAIENSTRHSRNALLRVMTAGPVTKNPAQLLAESKLISTLDALASNADLVVVDSAPVLELADAASFAAWAGATLFVVEANRSRASEVRKAVDRLRSNGVLVAGIVLTRYEGAKLDYAY